MRGASSLLMNSSDTARCQLVEKMTNSSGSSGNSLLRVVACVAFPSWYINFVSRRRWGMGRERWVPVLCVALASLADFFASCALDLFLSFVSPGAGGAEPRPTAAADAVSTSPRKGCLSPARRANFQSKDPLFVAHGSFANDARNGISDVETILSTYSFSKFKNEKTRHG